MVSILLLVLLFFLLVLEIWKIKQVQFLVVISRLIILFFLDFIMLVFMC